MLQFWTNWKRKRYQPTQKEFWDKVITLAIRHGQPPYDDISFFDYEIKKLTETKKIDYETVEKDDLASRKHEEKLWLHGKGARYDPTLPSSYDREEYRTTMRFTGKIGDIEISIWNFDGKYMVGGRSYLTVSIYKHKITKEEAILLMATVMRPSSITHEQIIAEIKNDHFPRSKK